MGADLGNPPVTGAYESEHPHESWNENSCTTCHMYRRPYIDSANPQLWGHNFEPRYERCITCHSNFTDEAEFWAWVEEYQVEIDGMLQAFLDAWPGAWIDGDGEPVSVEDEGDGTGPPELDPVGNAYRAALWNYYVVLNDASRGVHNPTFTKDLLEQATAAVDALPDP
jgi:formate-dependent nitrite reductase cytochrome c552 subunit